MPCSCVAAFQRIKSPFGGDNGQHLHHVADVVECIQQTGALIQFLPPYSPDFNPTEVFSIVKKFLVNNDFAFSTTSSPSLLITMAFSIITTLDCISYIKHAGYKV